MPTNTGCQAVTNAFIYETGRIGPDLFRRGAAMRPIVGLVGSNRGTWTNSMGVTVSNVTFERSFSTSVANPWSDIAPSDGASVNACLPPVTTVAFGQTQRQMTPQTMAIQTGYFCIRDILFDWQFSKNLSAVKNVLNARTSWEWARKWTNDYVDNAGHNLTAIHSTSQIFDNGSSGYSVANAPTAALNYSMLETIWTSQYREGPSVQGVAMDTEAPVAVAIVSDETYRELIRNNTALAASINYAWMGARDDNPLLPSGIPKKRRLFGAYVFYTDPYPRRFVILNGAYVEIPVWVSSPTTKGNKQEINPDWVAAPYEETIIYTPDNFRSLAYNTMTNPSPTWNFDAINSMGDWSVRNILERDCNPDGTEIFWRAVFGDVAEPINPAVGYSILSLRCPYGSGVAVTCQGS